MFDTAAAFYWSLTSSLPPNWRKSVRHAVRGIDAVMLNTTETRIELLDRNHLKESWKGVRFDFRRDRGSGLVVASTNELLTLVALKIAHVLDFDLSDDASNSLPKGKPLEWLGAVGIQRPIDEIEQLAVKVGLVPKRIALNELAAGDALSESFFF